MSSTRHSPPTERVVALLDQVVAHPDRAFGLSDLARASDISKPTCLGILTTLADRGWLVCDADSRAYRIGPALVSAGQRARRAVPGADVAQHHLADLADRFATTCTASAVMGEQIVVVASASADGPAAGVEVGARYPFAPPAGLRYVLWDGDAAIEQWLDIPHTVPVRLDRDHLSTVVAEGRERGFLVEGLTDVGPRLHTLLAGVAAYDLPTEIRALVGELVTTLGERVLLGADLAARGPHPTHLLAAPTYGADGGQHLVVTMYVGSSISTAEITRRGRALTATAQRITRQTGGRVPGVTHPPGPTGRATRKAKTA